MSTGKIKQLAFSEGVTVGTPSDIAALAVGLVSYASEAAFVSAEGAATAGDAFYDTTANALKYYNGSTWISITTGTTPTTTRGDLIKRGVAADERLAVGTTGQVLKSDGTDPSWGLIVNANIDASAAIDGSKLVAATNLVAGAMTTSAQSFAGLKTFYDGIKLDDAAGQSTLDYYETGTFTATVTGCTTSPTGTARYVRLGSLVSIYFPAISGTSNSTAMTITGMPAALYPAREQRVWGTAIDSGDTELSQFQISAAGVITCSKFTDADSTANFTNSGTKGTNVCTITYNLE